MECKSISCLLDEIGTGITNPINALIDTTRVIVKLLNNDESNRVLINELVSYQIAEKLNLPIPNYGVGIVDNRTDLQISIDSNQIGKCFYTERIDKVTSLVDNKKLIQNYIANKSDFLKIILFDNLIYNKDRHKGNILMNTGFKNKDNCIYVIDHTHVFDLGPMWNKYQLCNRIRELDYKNKQVMEYNQETYKILVDKDRLSLDKLLNEADVFKKVLTSDIIYEMLENVPEEWEMDEWDKTMLFNYINYRVMYIDDICKVIFDYIINNF